MRILAHVHPNNHETVQHPCLSLFSNVSRAARVAASNTSSTPSPVKDEHSRYFLAPISRAAFVPSFSVVKCKDFLRISSWAIGSSLRSFFSPTSSIGTSGQRSFASSTHCRTQYRFSHQLFGPVSDPTLCFTLSSESGVSIEKPIRITWAFE